MRGTPNDELSNYKQMLVGVSYIYAVISCKKYDYGNIINL